MKIPLLIFLLVSALILSSCEASVPDGQIRIKNDSQDSEYNVVDVSGGGKYFSLKPGEAELLPKGTVNISLSRQYKNYTRRYRIECPRDLDRGITIKMIDAHTNRMPGGCSTVSATKN